MTIGTRLYLFGGCDTRNVYGELNLLEIEQMKWSELPCTGDKPPGRYGHSLNGVGEKTLVVFGGMCDV